VGLADQLCSPHVHTEKIRMVSPVRSCNGTSAWAVPRSQCIHRRASSGLMPRIDSPSAVRSRSYFPKLSLAAQNLRFSLLHVCRLHHSEPRREDTHILNALRADSRSVTRQTSAGELTFDKALLCPGNICDQSGVGGGTGNTLHGFSASLNRSSSKSLCFCLFR
jgi:hypothetical protein